MDRLSIVTLAASKSYTDASVAGGGAIKGKNATMKSSTPIEGGTRIVFAWYLDSGVEQTTTVDVMNGIDGQDGAKGDTGNGVKSASIVENHLILTLDDDTTVDAGLLTNLDTTFEHIADISLNNLVDGQILKFNAITGKWENASAGTVDTSLVDLNDVAVDNLTDGQIIVWDATAGRWKNADNSPSITVDPTPTQGSNNAVASGGVYTALQGKADSSDVPTKTSDLTNDSGFQTASDVATAISGKVDTSAVGTTVASLTDGKVPASQLPSYVDDVIEAEDVMHFPVTGESGKIYVALDTNKTYRWSGSGYVEISESLALGETSSTAYAGNKGKANADAIDAIKDGTSIDSFSDVESALADKVDTVSGKGLSTNDYTTAEQTKLAGVTTGANRAIKTSYTLDRSSWVQQQVGGYKYVINLNPGLDASFPVNVQLNTTGNGDRPSDDEIFAYNECIYGGYLQTTSVEPEFSSTLEIYAIDIPYRKDGTQLSALKIWVEGIVKEAY